MRNGKEGGVSSEEKLRATTALGFGEKSERVERSSWTYAGKEMSPSI